MNDDNTINELQERLRAQLAVALANYAESTRKLSEITRLCTAWAQDGDGNATVVLLKVCDVLAEVGRDQ